MTNCANKCGCGHFFANPEPSRIVEFVRSVKRNRDVKPEGLVNQQGDRRGIVRVEMSKSILAHPATHENGLREVGKIQAELANPEAGECYCAPKSSEKPHWIGEEGGGDGGQSGDRSGWIHVVSSLGFFALLRG